MTWLRRSFLDPLLRHLLLGLKQIGFHCSHYQERLLHVEMEAIGSGVGVDEVGRGHASSCKVTLKLRQLQRFT
ncbi:hypothetical protein OUZ56_012280 [Daphnia magna]|uniref:Secreted protein n=1 Tax=Daphnia magna TaxID=35525 RepID=A0ABQ9Z2Q5_9CRUS|nr:hypothetical protein OUZ56_012280 [Daphnia magna]